MRRTRLGLGAAAAATALGLLVGGCGSSDSDGGGSSSNGQASGGSGGKSESRPDDGGPGGGDGGNGNGGSGSGGSGPDAKPNLAPYLGPWASGTESDGDTLQLLMFQKDATVSLAGQNLACQGTLDAAAKPAKLSMECQDGSDTYASGTITDVGDEKLTVAWTSGGTVTYRKGADAVGPPGD